MELSGSILASVSLKLNKKFQKQNKKKLLICPLCEGRSPSTEDHHQRSFPETSTVKSVTPCRKKQENWTPCEKSKRRGSSVWLGDGMFVWAGDAPMMEEGGCRPSCPGGES